MVDKFIYVNKLIQTYNSLEYHRHHRNDNKNVPSLDVYKVRLCLSSEHYKIDIQDGLGEMYYQGLHILHA